MTHLRELAPSDHLGSLPCPSLYPGPWPIARQDRLARFGQATWARKGGLTDFLIEPKPPFRTRRLRPRLSPKEVVTMSWLTLPALQVATAVEASYNRLEEMAGQVVGDYERGRRKQNEHNQARVLCDH